MNRKVYEQPHAVALGLLRLFDNIIEILAAVEALEHVACMEHIPHQQAPFLNAAYKSLWDDLIVKTAALYDGDSFKQSPNCSINELRVLIEEDKKHTEHQKENILATIDNLRKRYTFKEYRNKAKAHFDLETMFDSPFSTVSTDEIKELLFGLRDVVSLTFGMMFGIRMEEYPYLEKKQQYEDAILSCIKRRN